MPRSLVSFWKRVAISGPTIDGRDILPQELRDIAETYKSSTYTAVIWCDHDRWYGSHGTVFAVRLVEDAEDLLPGQVALEAQLKPNDKLLWLNDQGEKLFTSIEITPNFTNTGKAYLTGLAVTDEPASLGTQELYFSRKTSKAAYYAASVELGPLSEKKLEKESATLLSMFTSLFKSFGLEQTSTETTTPPTTESTSLMDEATGTALKALRDQLLIIAAGIDTVIEGAAADAPDPDTTLTEGTQAVVDDIVTTAETEREFKRQAKDSKSLAAGMARMEKMFSQLQNTPAGRQLQRTNGNADKSKRVL